MSRTRSGRERTGRAAEAVVRGAARWWMLGLSAALAAGCGEGSGKGAGGGGGNSAGVVARDTGPGLAPAGGGLREALVPPRVTTPDPTLAESLAVAFGVLSTNRTSADAWGRYGQGLEAAEFLAEARTCYGRALELDPDSARWAHLLGLLELADSPDRGFERLEWAIRLGGAGEEASRVRLAQALVERGRFREAEPHVAALLARDAGHAAARLELARLRLFEGRLGEAGEALAPCLTNPFTARSAAQLLGQVRGREGNVAEADRWTRKAAGMGRPFDWPDPYQREVQAWRGDGARRAEQINGLLARQRFTEADALLAEALARRPEDPELLLLAGRSLLQQRRCPEAEARFREHLRVVPDSLNGLTQLALALLCQQRWADAVPVLERSVALKPDFAQAHGNLGVARSQLGDRAGAIRSYREALRCSPGDARQHAALAEELARAGDGEEARSHARQALQLDPGSERAKAVLGRLGER